MELEVPWRPTNNELLVLWCLREEGRTQGAPARMTKAEIVARTFIKRGTAPSVIRRLETRGSWVYCSGSVMTSGKEAPTYSLSPGNLDAIDATLQKHEGLVQALWSGREHDRKTGVPEPLTPDMRVGGAQGPKENQELRRFQRLKYRLASDAPMMLIDADEFLFALAYGPEENPSDPMQSLFEPHMQDALVQLMRQNNSPRERGAALRQLITKLVPQLEPPGP